MPRFAANLTLLFNEAPFVERFARAARAGFKAVECLFPYAFDKETLAARLEQYGLVQALLNMPPGDWDAGERGLAALPGRAQEFRQGAARALDYARAMNCKKVHAMSGIVDPAQGMQQHIKTFVANVRYAADLFAEHGIEVLIEPLNSRDVPNYFVAHQRRAVELIQMVDRPNVKLQLDLYHAQIMDGDLTILIRDLAPFVGHVQIASVPHRHEPCDGELNYPYLFRVLDESGYDGWIGCEYHPKTNTEEGLDWIKPYL